MACAVRPCGPARGAAQAAVFEYAEPGPGATVSCFLLSEVSGGLLPLEGVGIMQLQRCQDLPGAGARGHLFWFGVVVVVVVGGGGAGGRVGDAALPGPARCRRAERAQQLKAWPWSFHVAATTAHGVPCGWPRSRPCSSPHRC